MNHLNIKQIEEILLIVTRSFWLTTSKIMNRENLLLAINVSHSGRIF